MTAIATKATGDFAITIDGKVRCTYEGKRDVSTFTFTEAQLRALYQLLTVTLR